MSTETQAHSRINKREFISRVASRSGLSMKLVGEVYGAMVAELMETVRRGETIVLTGFGRFCRQAHKGHKVRFGKKAVPDYFVLKFSASRSVNRKLGGEEELTAAAAAGSIDAATNNIPIAA